jgi:MFS family permease
VGEGARGRAAYPPLRRVGAGDKKAPAGAWPLTVLFFINVLNFYDRQALGAITEPLRREFHLSDTQLGALTTIFTVVYAVAGVPLGRLADTWSRKRLLAMGTAVWAGLTGLGGLAASYAMLLGTRLGVGIGEAVCAPAATSWIGDVVPPERRARVMAWFMMAVPVGGMLSFAVTGPVAQAHGWRVALALAALPAAALIPALLCLREAPRASLDPQPLAPSPQSPLKLPPFWWIVASGALVNFALYSFSTFLPTFLTRFHGLSVARAGFWTGIGAGAAGILGALAAGVFGDRITKHRGRGRMRLAGGAALLAAPLAFCAIRLPAGRAAIAIPLIMAAYGLLQSYYGLVYAAMQDIVAPGLRGAAMGTYFMAMYLCGASFGPLATGGLSDHFARSAAGTGAITEAARAMGLREAMYVIPVFCLALAAVLWGGARAMDGASPPESTAHP